MRLGHISHAKDSWRNPQRHVIRINAHTTPVACLAFSPGGKQLATASGKVSATD